MNLQKYVQDYLLQNKQSVYELLTGRGHMYVCGSINMADDVTNTIQQILQMEGNMSEGNSKNYVARMKVNTHYFVR